MSNREQKSIIIGTILALIIFIGLVLILLKYIYPNFIIIEEGKNSLSEKIEKSLELNLKGFDFNEFKELNSLYSSSEKEENSDKELYDSLNDEFYKKISNEIDESFYNNSLYNGDYDSFNILNKPFIEYLDESSIKLIQFKNSKKFNDKIGNLALILPKYSSYLNLDSRESLTDLEFINSVELLLRKFNLKTTSPIGIKEVLPFYTNVNSKEDIYYIPLGLDITGSKSGIIDFMNYIKNSGSVQFNQKNFDFIDKNEQLSQLSEIESLEIKQYIDSSSTKRSAEDYSLRTFLEKTEQLSDIVSVNFKLNFYVNGVSSEKIINEINNIVGNNISKIKIDKNGNLEKNQKTGEYEQELLHYNYSNILRIVKKINGNTATNKNAYYKMKANDIFLYLNNKEFKKDIATIRKELNKTDDINALYLRALKYKEIFLKIDKEIYDIVKSLEIDKNEIYSKNYLFK